MSRDYYRLKEGWVVSQDLALESLYLGALPIIRPFIERLRLAEFFQESFGRQDSRIKLPDTQGALLLVRNFTLSRHPLYGVPLWVRRFDPQELGLKADQIRLVNDDRLGRILDRLFKADLRTLMTRIIVHTVQEFHLDLKRLHNDSTSITFSGEYKEKPPRNDGRRRLKIVLGYNKDHRPDLKQLVWTLTVTEDGAVPVHYNVYDGNVTDDKTHIDTWEVLRQIVGSPKFIYVADSKLCTRENMGHIDRLDGQFITVLPQTRKEDARFKDWMLKNPVPWEVIHSRPPLRRKNDPPERFEAVEGPELSSEGYRIIWYRSSEKWKRDERARDNSIQWARQEIHRVRERAGTRKLKTREQIQAAVDRILDQTETRHWLQVDLSPREKHVHKQAGPGRPGKNTLYVRLTDSIYEPIVKLKADTVRASAASDGIFPLITNIPKEEMSPLKVLAIYKYQSFVEKRHEQLKTAAEVVPVNFKTPERIESYLFLFFISVLIHALLERQIRQEMKKLKLKSIPLYPEERPCRAPTADKIIELFEPIRRHRLLKQGKTVKTFWDELTKVHRTVLQLLNLPAFPYGG